MTQLVLQKGLLVNVIKRSVLVFQLKEHTVPSHNTRVTRSMKQQLQMVVEFFRFLHYVPRYRTLNFSCCNVLICTEAPEDAGTKHRGNER